MYLNVGEGDKLFNLESYKTIGFDFDAHNNK